MTTTQIYIIAGLIAYFILMIYIGITQGRKSDHTGFVIGARDVGTLPTIGSLAAGFRDGAGIVWWISAAYTAGYSVLWGVLGAFIGFSTYAIVGPKARATAKERGYVTIGAMIKDQIGPLTKRFVSILIAVLALVFMAMQFYVCANIFSTVLDQPRWMGTVAIGVIVAFYLFSGGYGSVVKTDLLQFILIVGLILLPLFVDLPQKAKSFETFVNFDMSNTIAIFLLFVFWPLSLADTWQRVFSARDDKVIRTAFPFAGPILLVMTASLIVLGFSAQLILPDDIDPNMVAFALFEYDGLSAPILSYLAVALVAICMSTLDTQTYLLTSTVLKDILPEGNRLDRDAYIRSSQVIMLLAIVIVGFLSHYITDLVQFIFEAGSLMFVLSPLFLLTSQGVFKGSKRMDMAMISNLLLCSGVYIYMFSNDIFDINLNYLYVPLAISIVTTSTLCLVSRKTDWLS